MKKIYYLSTCSTCKRILKEINAEAKGFDFQDIKTEPITRDQLKEMAKLSGSYESLFSRRSQKFRPMGLHKKTLTETDYAELILTEYTFLKRPVAIVDEDIFVGNSKSVIESLQAKLNL